MIEEVVLVDEKNNVLGTIPKAEAHNKRTPLHRAFSVFIFRKDKDKDKELLIQQRSHKKKTWPNVWSNSCCGHPGLKENNIVAAKRRLKYELGISAERVEEISPYRYKFSRSGVMENEICPILAGFAKNEPKINKKEVEDIRWVSWKEFLKEIKKSPRKYSPWCIEQAKILNKNKKFKELMK